MVTEEEIKKKIIEKELNPEINEKEAKERMQYANFSDEMCKSCRVRKATKRGYCEECSKHIFYGPAYPINSGE